MITLKGYSVVDSKGAHYGVFTTSEHTAKMHYELLQMTSWEGCAHLNPKVVPATLTVEQLHEP